MDNGGLTQPMPLTRTLMKTPSISLDQLSQRVEKLEAQQTALLEALKLLLPMAITIPSTTANSAQAVKVLKQALARSEETAPRSEDFWYLASAMALTMSSQAVEQFPNDPEVVAIFQGIRQHKMQ